MAIYEEWCGSIDLAQTRVVNSPSLIFLCGGEISNSDSQFLSCRDIFYRYILQAGPELKSRVILAERIFDYFELSCYKDLLLFEKDLAELSSLIVLFSESPGSLAELGAFTVLETTQNRLLVVMHKDYSENESFIWRGPASFLQRIAKDRGDQDPISVYRWRQRNGVGDRLLAGDFADAEDLYETMRMLLSKTRESETFRPKDLGHVMLLMLELLRVLQIATFDRIARLLADFGIQRTKVEMDQYLSLLVSLGLAVRNRYGNNVFFLSTENKPWIRWAFRDSAKIRDIDRWSSLFSEHYTKDEVKKARALRSHLKSLE